MRISRQGEALRVRTPAKINLSLHIQGRRADGYHNLRTLMVSIRLHDTLLFAPSPTGEVSLRIISGSSQHRSLPVDDRNLIVRAAHLLQRETGHSQGVEIILWKTIPSEAGMGGGSSDAAATLTALNQFWELELGSARLHELAATLGSDVNFFLDSLPAACCTGRGEKIEARSLQRSLHVVIIKPPLGLSTGQVFQTWGELQKPPAGHSATSRGNDHQDTSSSGRSVQELRQLIANDLEQPARLMNSELEQLLDRLHRLDVIGSGMTGSGSACFAVCRTARQANVIAGRCRNWKSGQVFVVSSGV